jgi:zinc transport system ATP-binding protein
MTDVLQVRDLTIRFGEKTVLANLSFCVRQGETLAVIGPNGSGKTVLFRALIGALPYQGQISWMPGVRIGYVPQKLDIARDLPVTGIDLLEAKAGVLHAQDDQAALLDRVGLPPENAAMPIGWLSGGQFQRLLLALALIGQPNVLLLDEPTAGIDIPGQETLNELVHRLQAANGLTVMLISHDLSVVYRDASAILCLGWERTCFGPPQDVLTPERLQAVYGMPVRFHAHDQ